MSRTIEGQPATLLLQGVVTGYTEGAFPGEVNHGGFDAFVGKYDLETGVELWVTQFGGSGDDTGRDVVLDAAGNIYLVGDTTIPLNGQPNAGGLDAFVMKLDPQGNHIWTWLIGGNGDDRGHAVAIDAAGAVSGAPAPTTATRTRTAWRWMTSRNAPFPAFCDMDADGGGLTNLDFAQDRLHLAGGHFIECTQGLERDASSVTCRGPVFDGDASKWLYQYRCDGTDRSADYLLDHVAARLGHNAAATLGFTMLAHPQDSSFGVSANDEEYCYVNGAVIRWDQPGCAQYAAEGNAPCAVSWFRLSR